MYRCYGGPEVLEFTELPAPKTHVDSVLVRVKAAGLNHADAAIQAGALDGAVETFFPVVPGWDVAGVVERSGPGGREFAAGDEVIAYVRGEVDREGVVHPLAVQAGETVLVLGAAGGVGSIAVQIALARGARLIAVASSDDHGYLRTLSAEPVARGAGLAEQVRSLVPDGADAVFDAAGRGALASSAGSARPGTSLGK